MKKITLIIFIAILGFTFSTSSYAQDKMEKKQGEKMEMKKDAKDSKSGSKEEMKGSGSEMAVVTEVKEGKAINTVCPVSGETIDDPVLISYKGKTYAVCCKSCLKKIKKDPEKYISRISEDGKTVKMK